jgi:phosphoglycolate phosphatase
MFKHLIFDLDGTLIDSVQDIADCLKLAYQDINWSGPLDFKPQHLNTNFKEMIAKLTPNLSFEQTVELTKRFRHHYDVECSYSNTQLYPQIKELFDFLSQLDVKFYLCSLKPKHATLRILNKFGLTHYFKEIKCIDSLPTKPNVSKQEIVQYLMRVYNMENAETLFVCDTDNDVKTANIMKIPCAVHLGGYGSLSSIQQEHPSYMFPNYDFIFKLFNATLRDLI